MTLVLAEGAGAEGAGAKGAGIGAGSLFQLLKALQKMNLVTGFLSQKQLSINPVIH